MTRIFPQSVTIANVSALQRELGTAKPYTDDKWQTASFDFNTFDIVITIRLPDGRVGDAQLSRVQTVIRLLPELQARVIEIMGKPENDEPNDDHALSWIDVDVDDGEVDLCYNGISYNTQWNYSFHIREDGSWTPTH